MKNTKKAAYLLPVLAGCLWGTAGFFVRTLTGWGMNSITLLESRVWIGTLVLAVILFIKDRTMLKIKIKDLWVFAAASLIGTLGLNICYNISINTLTLSFAAVLLGLSPVFVVLMAAPLFKEKITVRKAICTAAAVAGCVMVSGLFDSGTVITWSLPGILIGVLSGFFYALYSIFSRIAMDRGYHPLTVTFYSFLMLTVVLIPFTDWNVIGEIMTTDPLKNNTIMITHSLCVTILPYVFYNLALKYMETGMVSVLASAEPVAAMVFGAIIYSEMPSAVSLCGLILVLAALAVLSLSPIEK